MLSLLYSLKIYLAITQCQIAYLISPLLKAVEKSDNNDGRNVEAALLWYRNVLGFCTEGGKGTLQNVVLLVRSLSLYAC